MTTDTTDAPPADSGQIVSLMSIYLAFLKIGGFSFGGGVTAWMYREIVEKLHWMTEDDFLSGTAMGQALPGANVSNLAVFIGQRLRGLIGATIAVAGILTFPFIIVLALMFIAEYGTSATWDATLEGVAAAAIGLLLLIGWKAAKRCSGSLWAIAVIVATFVAVGIMRWPLVSVVLCIAPLSVAAAWFRGVHNAE